MLGLGLSRRKLLFGGFLALFLMIFGTVLVPSGETWAYENTCRAFVIGTDKGEKNETVCVSVDDKGNAKEVDVKKNTLIKRLKGGGSTVFSEICTSKEKSNCYTYSEEKNPEKILNEIGKMFEEDGKSYDGATLNGAVKSKTVQNVNDDYESAGGTNDEDGDEDEDDTATQDDDSGTEVDCVSSGAAKSLGWIVCPVLDWMSSVAESIYEKLLEPSLQIKSEFFTNTNGGGTKDAWETFRNIANILLSILLLVVIFSQLTGVGINNYGIKKILPKLIVAALLMNLSYWICVALIDVSNILGNSLQALFNDLGENLTISSDLGDGFINGLKAAGSSIFSVVIFLAIMAVVGVAVLWDAGILLSLLVGAVGVIISILFLYILLTARQAAIVILTALSPLAVACMMMPRTKSLFDKWLKFFKSLLLVYPIAGLLIGGGNYVSKLLLSTGFGDNSIFGAITAMVIGVVPIFFIPTVLKNSIAAMGNLGAKFSGLGQKTRGWSQGKMRNSEIYKNAQEIGAIRTMRKKGGLDKDGNSVTGWRRTVANIASGGNRMRRKNALKYRSAVAKEGSLEAADGSEFMLAVQTANVAKELEANGKINSKEELEKGLSDALKEGNRAQIRAYTDALTAKGEDGRSAVKQVYDKAVGNGMSSASAKTFADNIMANHAAEYKNNNRALFEVAKMINGGEKAQTTDDFLDQVVDNGMSGRAKLATKTTPSTLANMDDKAFDEVFSNDEIPAGLDVGQRDALGATIHAALNDQNANIKTERRQKLEKLLRDTGYTPRTQNVNVTNDVLDVHET